MIHKNKSLNNSKVTNHSALTDSAFWCFASLFAHQVKRPIRFHWRTLSWLIATSWESTFNLRTSLTIVETKLNTRRFSHWLAETMLFEIKEEVLKQILEAMVRRHWV